MVTNTEYSEIYDYFYEKFCRKAKYSCKNTTKSKVIDRIFSELSWDHQTAIRAMVKYSKFDNYVATKITGIDIKKLNKLFEVGARYMYSPRCIKMAVPKFYKITTKKKTKLNVGDFDNRKFILTALNKQGIEYREQLYKHLSMGWHYLWTIPGVGNLAKEKILKAIDKWNEEDES